MEYGEGGRIDCIHLIERVESWAGHEHFGSMLRAYRNDRFWARIALLSLGRCLLRVVSLCSVCPLLLLGVLHVASVSAWLHIFRVSYVSPLCLLSVLVVCVCIFGVSIAC